MMFRTLSLIAAIVLAAGAGFSAAQNAPPLQQFRSTSDIVTVFVTVTSRDGRVITDLTRDDFQVFDNGKPQPLTVFDKAPQPIRLIALIDISGSMVGRLPVLRGATEELMRHLGPNDAIRVGTFGNEIKLSPSFTRDPAVLASWLPDDIVPNTATPLWNAADQAMGELTGVSEGRRVVLIMSDGKDSGPIKPGQRFLSQIEIGDRAQRDDVMIYGVGVYGSLRAARQLGAETVRDMMRVTQPDPGLGTLANETGGGYLELRGRDDLGAAFGRVMDELHQQYLLGFVPPVRDGKTHKIEVKIARPDVRPRARKNYVAPKASR